MNQPAVLKRRLKRVRAALAASPRPAALLVSSAVAPQKSADQHYRFRQDNNFYYLTGSRAEGMALLITTSRDPILIAPKIDKAKIVWEGKGPDPKRIASAIGAELVVTDKPESEITTRLRGVHDLYHPNNNGTLGWRVARSLIERPSHERANARTRLPLSFHHADVLLGELRLFKDPEEVEMIRHAAQITNNALHEIVRLVRPGTPEAEIAHTLEYLFKMQGGDVAFDTIVGSGRSAAVLHYRSLDRTLRNGEMLLIDCGAEFELYAADITRVLPVGGHFDPLQREIYSAVLEAENAAIAVVREGVSMQQVYDAAARELLACLRSVGILKGRSSSQIDSDEFRRYFPHGIGHGLGLDTHDGTYIRGKGDSILKAGMVLTIEPGLYFPSRIGRVPALGVRIEDDLLVTPEGSEIISEGFPKDPREVEALFAH